MAKSSMSDVVLAYARRLWVGPFNDVHDPIVATIAANLEAYGVPASVMADLAYHADDDTFSGLIGAAARHADHVKVGT